MGARLPMGRLWCVPTQVLLPCKMIRLRVRTTKPLEVEHPSHPSAGWSTRPALHPSLAGAQVGACTKHPHHVRGQGRGDVEAAGDGLRPLVHVERCAHAVPGAVPAGCVHAFVLFRP